MSKNDKNDEKSQNMKDNIVKDKEETTNSTDGLGGIPKSDFTPSSNDDDLNDFGYLWSIFKTKPSKVSVYSIFDGKDFWSLLKENGIESQDIITNGEVIIDEDEVINSYKYLVRLEKGIYLSFYEYSSEEHRISNLIFYYNNKLKDTDDINSYLQSFSISTLKTDTDSDLIFSYLSFSNGNLEIEPLTKKTSYLPDESDDIDFYDLYPQEIRSDMKCMIKSINNKNSGLHCIYGEKGCGKTSYISYLMDNIKKPVIVVPYNIAEAFFGSMDLIEVLKQNPNTLYIIDDAEGLFVNQNYLNSIIQILNGMFKKAISSNFLFSYNTFNINNIPKLIKENSNSLLKFSELSKKEVKNIKKTLKLEGNCDRNRICDVIDYRSSNRSSYF